MSTRTHIAAFKDIEVGEEFLSAEGRRYVKVLADPFREISSPRYGAVPSHARRPYEPDADLEERFDENAWSVEPVIRRDFDADEPVIRDRAPAAAEEDVHPDEACLECGGQMEMAGPAGPLACPRCDADLFAAEKGGS